MGVRGGVGMEIVDVVSLLVTELVTNAVLHGSGTVLLAVAPGGGGRAGVEVCDESPDLPVVVAAGSLMEHGGGLRLVTALTSNWGTCARRDPADGCGSPWTQFRRASAGSAGFER